MARSPLPPKVLIPLAATALFGVGSLLIVLGNYSDYGPEVPMQVRLIPMATVCSAVLLRRRAPVVGLGIGTAGVVLDLFLGVTFPVVIVYTENLYAAALYGPRKAMKILPAIAAVLGAALAVVVAFLGAGLSDVLIVLAIWVGVTISPLSTAIILRQARERALLEAERAEQAVRLADVRRREAVLRERAAMARELHDTVANYLSAIALQATGLQAREDADAETVRRSVAAVRQSSVEGLAELRRIIGLLRTPDAGEELASHRLDQLPALVERLRSVGLAIEYEVVGAERELPGPVETAAFRVAQEALTNALKYGSHASVTVAYRPDSLTVEVVNDVDAEAVPVPSGGAGLVGMTERVRLLGGTLQAGPAGRRWRVRADIPTGGNDDQGSAR